MYVSRGISVLSNARTPTWILVGILVAAAALTVIEQVSISKVNGWWLDELFSLWVSDPAIGFGPAFRERILPDSNPPLYFSLLYWLRSIFSDNRTAVYVTNFGSLALGSAAVFIPSRRLGLGGLAAAAIAIFALSGPFIYFVSMGRSYAVALVIVFVASWYACIGLSERRDLLLSRRLALAGICASLVHVFATLFCGALAAGLLAVALIFKRKELVKPALALGISTSLVFLIWFGLAIGSLGKIDWIEFSFQSVLVSIWEVRTITVGTKFLLPVLAALFVFGLFHMRTRALFAAFGTAFVLFLLLPILGSFVQPIITGRYWMIGAPALPVLLCFAVRNWLIEASQASGAAKWAAASTAMLILAMTIFGFSNAIYLTSQKPIWKGAAIVQPLLPQCENSAINVAIGRLRGAAYINDAERFTPWTFSSLTGASPSRWKDVRDPSTSRIVASEASCAVLGWAEHVTDLEGLSNQDILRLMKIEASLDDVDILSHGSGFVVQKHHR